MATYYDEIEVTENDYGQEVEFKCLVDDEEFDLTGYTVTFSMKSPRDSKSKVNKAQATVSDATGGVIRYIWRFRDLSEPGVYKAIIRASKDGIVITFRGLTIIVREEEE